MRRWPESTMAAIARLQRSRFATRPRAPRPPATCGHCQHGHEGHGTQYGALVGWHTWAPEKWSGPKDWSEICVAPKETPDD